MTSQSNRGSSALHLSAIFGHTSIVQLLVEHFQKENKIEAQNKNGNTAIDDARQNNHDDIVDILTKALEGD